MHIIETLAEGGDFARADGQPNRKLCSGEQLVYGRVRNKHQKYLNCTWY